MRVMHFSKRRIAVAGMTLALAGCSTDVQDPSVVQAETIDPIADARVFSLSAQQNFYVAYTAHINNTGIFSTELWTGAVRNETNDIARHVIVDTNVDLSGSFWSPLQVVIGTNDQVVSVLKAFPRSPGVNVTLAPNGALDSTWFFKASMAASGSWPGARRMLNLARAAGIKVLEATSTAGTSMPMMDNAGLVQRREPMVPLPASRTPSSTDASAR